MAKPSSAPLLSRRQGARRSDTENSDNAVASRQPRIAGKGDSNGHDVSNLPSASAKDRRANQRSSWVSKWFCLIGTFACFGLFYPWLLVPEAYLELDSVQRLKGRNEEDTRKQSFTQAPPQKDQYEHLHVIFSTDCTAYQHWQSYLLYYSALQVQQPGSITRIASGCSEKELSDMRDWHARYVRPLSPRFHIHFTPAFSAAEKDGRMVKYEYFNKPFGLLHFLQFFSPSTQDGISSDAFNNKVLLDSPPSTNDASTYFVSQVFRDSLDTGVVVLLDPDMIFLRPITGDLTPSSVLQPKTTDQSTANYVVAPGKPLAQLYGFGSQWRTLDLAQITSSSDSPALSVQQRDASRYYAVGPPYIATTGDMYRIAFYWSTFAPRVHAQYPKLLAEMFAYCIAAAHSNLPHTVFSTFMISDQSISETIEGWGFLNHIPDSEVCTPTTVQNWSQVTISQELSMGNTPEQCPQSLPSCHQIIPLLPHVLHYCQRYMVQEWFFGKRKYNNYFNCRSPILTTPPPDLGAKYDYRVRPGDPVTEHMELSRLEAKKSAFMICRMTKAVQDASKYFKSNHCSSQNDEETNWSETLNLFQLFYS